MFENREFAVRMRKADKTETPTQEVREQITFDEKIAIAVTVGRIAAFHLAVGVAGYVLLDTFRQVQIAKNTNPPLS